MPNLEIINQGEITNYNSKTTEFLNVIISNNYNEYKNICDSKMGTDDSFNKVKDIVNKNIKSTKNLKYIETEKKDDFTSNIYKLENNNVIISISITFNKEGQVAGFYIINNVQAKDVKNYNQKTTELLNAIDTNNFNNYKAICTEKMGAKSAFDKLVDVSNQKLGTAKSFQYIQTINSNGNLENVYKGNFEKGVMNFKVTLDNTGKVEGFFIV
ncbi:MAG: hypothetical protein ACRDDY_04960, partial [Clostridium sp.]|uniref:hypothetical protein n=1 Tax=Clostridium sp. TaxID=1506 RepID=UPI003EE65B87